MPSKLAELGWKVSHSNQHSKAWPCWLMGRFLFHSVHQGRTICQDQDCETGLFGFQELHFHCKVALLYTFFGPLYHLTLFLQIYNQYNPSKAMWIKLSVGSNWLFVRVVSFYFVPGSSYEILEMQMPSKSWKTTAPTSPAKLKLQLQESFEPKYNRVDNIAVSECMRWWPSAWCCHHQTSGMCVLPPLLSWPAWPSWMPTWWSRIRGHGRSASASLSLLGMSAFLLSSGMWRFGSEQKCGRLDEDTLWSFGSSISSCWRSSFTLSSRTVRLIARVWRRSPGRLWLYCCPFVCQASTWFWWLWTAWNTSVRFGGRRTWGVGSSGWLWTCWTCWICRQIFGSHSGRVCPFGRKVWCSSTATFCFWFFPACPWARSACRVTTCPLRRWCSILFSVWSPSTSSPSSYVASTWCSSRTAGFPPSSLVRTWWPSRPRHAPFSSTGNSRVNSQIERTQLEFPWKSSRTRWDTDKLFRMLRASHMNPLQHGRLWIHDQGTKIEDLEPARSIRTTRY